VRPAWDTGNVVDMALAAQGQAALRFWLDGVNSPPPPAAGVGLLTVYGNMGVQEALALMGLTAVEVL